jgi:phosphomannomutase
MLSSITFRGGKMAVQNDIKFGTDGWRGIMAWDFTFGKVRRLSQAMADFIFSEITAKKMPSYSVIVGYDTRFLSDKFAYETAKVLKSNKIKVILSKTPVPAPLISLMTKKNFNLGVMITASHNPFQYNGVKIKIHGRSAGTDTTEKIESLIGKHSPLIDNSVIIKTKDFTSEYIKYIKSKFNLNLIKSRIKKPVAIDYMFGAQIGKMEKILPLKKLMVLNGERNAMFGGIAPEPVEQNLQNLIKTVRSKKLPAGFAFDGDGDRMAAIDEQGRLITPCQLFPLILKYLIETKKLKGKIVQTVSMGYLSKKIAKANGFDFEEVPVGFKHVAERIENEKVLAGAEESGGFTWKGVTAERDGLTAALIILEIMAKTDKKLSQLVGETENKYGKSIFLRKDFKLTRQITDKKIFIKRLIRKLPKKITSVPVAQTADTDGLKIFLQNGHWFLIRPSGTENRLRIYAESDSQKTTNELINYGSKLVSTYVT